MLGHWYRLLLDKTSDVGSALKKLQTGDAFKGGRSFFPSWVLSNPPAPPPPPPPVRLHLEGKRIMLGSREFVPRGFVAGHGELVQSGDEARAASMGANFRRDGLRWWGQYGQGFQVDSEFDLNPGNINENYFAARKASWQRTQDSGQRVLLFMDSNCGQGLGGDVCKLDGVTDSDFFMTSGAGKRELFIQAAEYAVSNAKGLIDMIEPIVEPAGSATRESLWAFQEEFMNRILDIDPDMIFVIGGLQYGAAQITNCYKKEWAQPFSRFYGKVVITCNFLNNIATNQPLREQRMGLVLQARAQRNCPVLIQQVGTTIADDPTNVHLDGMLALLEDAAGGPIGYTWWEETSIFPNSYGPWSLADSNDPNSTRVVNTARRDALAAHFSL